MSKNKLYLKIKGKIKEGSSHDIDFYINDLKQREIIKRAEARLKELGVSTDEEITEEHRSQIDWEKISVFTADENENFRNKAIEKTTYESYKLYRVDKHFPNLNLFLFDNHQQIKEPNALLLLSNINYNTLLKNNNFDKETDKIVVWWDSDNKYCTIKTVTKEEIDTALKENIIDTDKYNELSKLLD